MSTGRAELGGLGVTFNEIGVPDFSAIIAAGGKVTGCLPPDGQSCFIMSGAGVTGVQYAVEIDRGDGSEPIYAKSVGVTADGDVSAAQRQDAWESALKLFQSMADSLEEARAQCWQGRSAWIAPQRGIDDTA